MHAVRRCGGEAWPALGLGTWRFGEDPAQRGAEVAALRAAFEMGFRLIDTAEMYGEGGAERVVGQALAESLRAGTVRREEVRIVSKVYPHHASAEGVRQACARSLERLGIDRIDLYLLHWRGDIPLQQTLDGFERLKAEGKIGAWGVSNFDLDDMQELRGLDAGHNCATNQVYYAASSRGVEFDLLPWMQRHAMPLMAYSPLDEGKLARHAKLAALAAPLGLSAAQLALAWVLRLPNVLAIPKAGRLPHLRDNLAAADVQLDAGTLAAIDALFAPPQRRQPLAMI